MTRLVPFLLLILPTLGRADKEWLLDQSTLIYHVSHPLHQTEGVSHAARGAAAIHVDLDIQFAGQNAQYKQVPFQLATQGNQVRISGTIPATLSDFKIDPPSLLSIAVKNDVPIRVDMTWHPQ